MTHQLENEPIIASEGEQPDLDRINNLLEAYSNNRDANLTTLVSSTGEEILLPESVYPFLTQAIFYLRHEQAINIVPINKAMTAQEAADLLNVTKSYLITLLETGEIPYHKVGDHRKINVEDVLKYKEILHQKQQQGLRELTRLSQEIGETD